MRSPAKILAAIAFICVSVTTVGLSSTAQTTRAAASATYDYAPRPLKVHQTLTVAIPNTGLQNAPILLANYFHEFAKENLSVNTVVIPNPGNLPPLATGGLNIAVIAWAPGVFNAIASGQKLAAIGSPFYAVPGQGFYVQSQYKSCEPGCLRGKTIAMPAGIGTELATPLANWLATGHLNLSDVTVLNVAVFSNIPVALTQNVAQAAYLVPPFQKALLADGTIKLAQLQARGTLQGALVEGPSGFSHPQAVEAFLRALARTELDYLRPGFLHRRGMVNVLAHVLGEPASVVEATDEPVFDPTLSIRGYGPMIEALQKTWFSIGGLLNYATPLPANRVLNGKLLNAALGPK